MEWTKVLRGFTRETFKDQRTQRYWFWHEQTRGIINNTGLHKMLRSYEKNTECAQFCPFHRYVYCVTSFVSALVLLLSVETALFSKSCHLLGFFYYFRLHLHYNVLWFPHTLKPMTALKMSVNRYRRLSLEKHASSLLSKYWHEIFRFSWTQTPKPMK